MKRPPGIWFLLSAGVLWLSIQNVYGLKATELIFKRTSTSTTEVPTSSKETIDEVPSEAPVDVANATKSPLTGIPQLDYIYDPNLPRELNGYNLSSYPFFSRMPENITFKCEGLHDGFYASIPHKCQVYHQCLSNIRYDFLCANYTAFDQRTFICHFVSEVDCNNSPKFWHRNDALYIALTTTTIKPTPIVISPALTGTPRRPPPPLGRRRRPLRRRPQYEYYDEEYEDSDKEDDYEEPPRRRRKRPRPRPIYDDEYEEYDDRYERRGMGRHKEEGRRSGDERGKEEGGRNKNGQHKEDRRRNEDRRHEDGHRNKDGRHNNEDGQHNEGRRNEDRRGNEERYYENDDDRKSAKPNSRDTEQTKPDTYNDKRTPYEDNGYKGDRRREHAQDDVDDENNRRPQTLDKRRPSYDRPRTPQRRPYDDDIRDDKTDRRPQNARPQKPSKGQPEDEGVSLVKPHSSSFVFSQPRIPPRIKPLMPKNVPKTTSEKPVTVKKQIDEIEYDDYEDELPPPKVEATTKAPEPERSKRPKVHITRKPPVYDEDDYEEDNLSNVTTEKRVIVNADKEGDSRYTAPKFIPKDNKSRTTTTSTLPPTTTATTTTTETPRERPDPVVRVVKRPFLPSRGGNPYSVRGLQPVGAKALEPSNYEINLSDEDKFKSDEQPQQNGRQFPLLSQLDQSSLKQQFSNKPILTNVPESKQPQTSTRAKFTPVVEDSRFNPKVPERNPLDLIDNEYDVTLNDALNPTIPNLPIRNFPTSFDSPSSDYYYNPLRPRYDVTFNQPSETYRPKVIKQREEAIVAQPQTYRNQIYNTQNFRSNPQVTQANTRAFYSVF